MLLEVRKSGSPCHALSYRESLGFPSKDEGLCVDTVGSGLFYGRRDIGIYDKDGSRIRVMDETKSGKAKKCNNALAIGFCRAPERDGDRAVRIVR